MRTTGSILLLVWVLSAAAMATPPQPATEPGERPEVAAAPTADTIAPAPPPLPAWRLGMAFGYGSRSNPLIQSEDIPIVVDVDVAWFGERFFFDNGDLGVTLANNPALTLSLVSRINSDRVFFSKTETRFVRIAANGVPLSEAAELRVPERNYAVEAGLEILVDGAWGMLQLAAHHDVSNTHGGYEVFAEYSRGWRSGRWYLESALGLAFKSRALNDYYWGVRPRESSEALPAYQAASGFNPQARVQLGYYLSRHWGLSVTTEYERLNDDAAASPIVAERHLFGYFAGISYRF